MRRVHALLRHDLTRRSAYFSVSVVASTAVGVFSIPILISAVGATEWGLLAVMQVLGQVGAVVVAFGWGATGPSMIAALPRDKRRAFYADSLVVRAGIFLIAGPAVAGCGLAFGADPLVTWLSAVTYVLPGVNAAWYFIGTNRPGAMILLESLPAILGQVAGLVAVAISPQLSAYLLGTAIMTVVGVTISGWFALTRKDEGGFGQRSARRLRHVFRDQVPGFASMLSGSLVSNLPLILVGALAPAARPTFAMADRLFKYAVIVLAPVLQAIQGWVPEAGPEETPRRAGKAIGIAVALGVVGGCCLALLATPVSALLTLSEATVPWHVGIILGVAFLSECTAQIAGLASLVPLRGMRTLTSSSVVCATLGLPVLAGLTAIAGMEGAAVGIALISTSMATWRAVVALRLARTGGGQIA